MSNASNPPRNLSLPSVTEHLRADHRRLDAILDNVERSLRDGAIGEARERFKEFAVGLTRHIDVEERFLFAKFEEATGTSCGPTLAMRAEHDAVRRLVDEIALSLMAELTARTHVALGTLASALGPHNLKEERFLYAMADEALSDGERVVLVRELCETCP